MRIVGSCIPPTANQSDRKTSLLHESSQCSVSAGESGEARPALNPTIKITNNVALLL
jgi:hypothetical protein